MSGRAASATLLAAILGLACGTSQLAQQASRDLKCPVKQVEVTEVDELRQRADGCGRTLMYLCAPDMQSRVSCTRERPSVRKAAQDAASREFRCPPERVALDDGPDERRFDAKGCGRTASFTCTPQGDAFRCDRDGGAAVLDDAPRGAASAGAPPPR